MDARPSGDDPNAPGDGAAADASPSTDASSASASAPRVSGKMDLSGLGRTGFLGVLWAALPALGGFYLLAKLGTVSDWLQSHGSVGLAVYIAVFIVSAGLGLLPTYAQAVVGGWVFGVGLGLPGALAGFTGASLLGYAAARLATGDSAEHVIERDARALAVREALIGHGVWRTLGIVTLVRIPPNSPFALTNLVMASAGVRLLPYVIGTVIGMLPRTAVVVALAASGAASGSRDIQSFVKDRGTLPLVIGVVLTIIVLMVIGAIGNKAINRVVHGAGRPDETMPPTVD